MSPEMDTIDPMGKLDAEIVWTPQSGRRCSETLVLKVQIGCFAKPRSTRPDPVTNYGIGRFRIGTLESCRHCYEPCSSFASRW